MESVEVLTGTLGSKLLLVLPLLLLLILEDGERGAVATVSLLTDVADVALCISSLSFWSASRLL